MRNCNKCFLFKPLEEFHKQPQFYNGRNSICRSCRTESDKNKRKVSREIRQNIEFHLHEFEYRIPQIDGPDYIQITAKQVVAKVMPIEDVPYRIRPKVLTQLDLWRIRE